MDTLTIYGTRAMELSNYENYFEKLFDFGDF